MRDASFVPIIFHDYSENDCHVVFEKTFKIAKKGKGMKRDDIIAKSLKNNNSLKKGV